MQKVRIKTEEEMKIMAEGAKKLARVRNSLAKAVKVGVSAADIEKLANSLIKKEKAEASFKKVPGYRWATCVNVESGVVHGIPHASVIFKEDDVVSIDVGIYYKGFHTDTATSVYLGDNPRKKKFLEVGRRALKAGILQVKSGKTIGDISEKIEKEFLKANLTPIRSLTGHGVGKDLHEYPPVPNFVSGGNVGKIKLMPGFVLAVEVMYTEGKGDISIEKDGWTIRTRDGKISALFEETVAITSRGPIVLTK